MTTIKNFRDMIMEANRLGVEIKEGMSMKQLKEAVTQKRMEVEKELQELKAQEKEEQVMQIEAMNIVEPKKEKKQEQKVGTPVMDEKKEKVWKKHLDETLRGMKDVLAELNAAADDQDKFNEVLLKHSGKIIQETIKKVDRMKKNPAFEEEHEELEADSIVLHSTLEEAANKGASAIKTVICWIINLIFQVVVLILKIACRALACVIRGVVKTGGFIVDEFSNKKEEAIDGVGEDFEKFMQEQEENANA